MKPVFECNGEASLISGTVTFSHLDELSKELLIHAARQEDMKLNLQKVSDCDSAFAALLMACLQVKKQQNHTLVLVNSPRKLLSLFEVYGVSESGFQFS